jgi:hypothetical protein
MSTSLSKLVADGAGHPRLVFGAGGTPVAAEELAATGAGLVQVSEAAPDQGNVSRLRNAATTVPRHPRVRH